MDEKMNSRDGYLGSNNPNNPHEKSLGKFLRGRSVHISEGYARLPNGQIVKVSDVEISKP